MSKRLKELGAALDKLPRHTSAPTEERPSGSRAPASLTISLAMERDAAINAADEAKAHLQELKDGIPLDKLVKVPGRQRQLTAEEYAELRDNLRLHPLVTPITVRPLSDGKYEILSGHNRYDVYCELRESEADSERFAKIKASIDYSDPLAVDAEELALYANLLHPDLPVWEKYQGFKGIMLKNPDVKTHQQISDRTGINRRVVAQIMQLDDLPQAAKDLIASKPEAIGYNTVDAMAKAVRDGKTELAIEAIRQVIENGITQQAAVAMVHPDSSQAKQPNAEKKAKPARAANEPVQFTVGRKVYCRYVRNEKRIALNFTSIEDAAEVEEAIQAILNEQAKRREEQKK